MDPAGPRAGSISALGWWMFAVATTVFVVVIALYLVAIYRRRPPLAGQTGVPAVTAPSPASERRAAWTVIIGGIVVPLVILTILMVLNVRTMLALEDPERPADVVIEVTGHQFWWEVRYPELGVVTANEIHVPAGQVVRLNVTSADVIHSFWVPELMGKVDLIPGMLNARWLVADRPGIYRGECAEFCGVQHAKMELNIVAEEPEAFAAWAEVQRQPVAGVPNDPVALAGWRAFMRPSCMWCHTIRGTDAQGTVGPDLTHVGSRLSIAGGALPNNRGTLTAWITDPQGLKPGNWMPDLNMDLDSSRAIAVYLEGLK